MNTNQGHEAPASEQDRCVSQLPGLSADEMCQWLRDHLSGQDTRAVAESIGVCVKSLDEAMADGDPEFVARRFGWLRVVRYVKATETQR